MSRVFGSPPRAEGDPNNLERQSTSTRLGSATLCVPLREQRATPRIAVCVPQCVPQCPLQCSSLDCCSPLNYSGKSESPYHYSVFLRARIRYRAVLARLQLQAAINKMDTSPPPHNIAGRLKQPLLVRRQSTKTAVDCALECGSGKLDPSGMPGNDEFSVSNGLWEAADDGTRSATEGRFGIKFLRHHSSSQHPDKLLEYETEQLERHPFSIILDETRRASVLAMPHVLRSMAHCAVTAVAAIAASLVMEDEVINPNLTLTLTLTLFLTLTRLGLE